MRTYLIDSENNELIVDLTKTTKHSAKLVEFEFCTHSENETINKESIYIRKLAGNYYCSNDNKAWRKIARQHIPHSLLNVDQVFKVYRGFKPSGLSGGASGEQLTQMPGKVVKINVEIGQKVNKGDCVLILEAMKMENEIKTSVEGIVKDIHVKEGDALDSGVLMMEIE